MHSTGLVHSGVSWWGVYTVVLRTSIPCSCCKYLLYEHFPERCRGMGAEGRGLCQTTVMATAPVQPNSFFSVSVLCGEKSHWFLFQTLQGPLLSRAQEYPACSISGMKALWQSFTWSPALRFLCLTVWTYHTVQGPKGKCCVFSVRLVLYRKNLNSYKYRGQIGISDLFPA